MFNNLPTESNAAMQWTWADYKPYVDDLMARDLTNDAIDQWLRDYTSIVAIFQEVFTRLHIATDLDTTDEQATAAFMNFLQHIMPPAQVAFNQLNVKLVESGLEPEGTTVPMRELRTSVELFREANVPLNVQVQELGKQYDKISGAQTVQWDGAEKTLQQLQTVYQERDRTRREQAFRLAAERRLQDREALNDLWVQLFKLRQQIAQNAGYDNYLEYAWLERGRFDYTPQDAHRFHDAIEQVVVPAVRRLREQRQQRLGLETVRPWDLSVDLYSDEPLRPFSNGAELERTTATIFQQVDPDLGTYFQTMRADKLLDLDNRKGKSPGGYCATYTMQRKPFIFMNAVGIHDDVQTMLHEAGHAFHVFECSHWPYALQLGAPTEFAEVASMSMELLAAPYLSKDKGGFYTEAEAARARIEHLSGNITFWPYMAVVDAFQHWAYTSGDAATDPANCDAKWAELWGRFMHDADYSGLEDWAATGWQRKLHIYQIPFYYIEYGLAQLGAIQVWANSLQDAPGALSSYRKALALGNTATLPDLFAAAGGKLAFDADTLREAVELMETTIRELEPA